MFKLVGLWFALSVSGLTATVNPSKPDKASASTSLDTVYREARDYNGESGVGNSYNYRPYDRPQSRCISCLYAAMTGNQDRDRYSIAI